jgi:hypothetical protein
LLVGGSNVLFGLDSDVMTERTGIETVNMGTFAGLGLPYILYRVQPIVRQDDIVVLSPEYQILALSEAAPRYARTYCALSDPAYLLHIPPQEAIKVAFQIPYREIIAETLLARHGAKSSGYRIEDVSQRGDEQSNEVDRTPEDKLAKVKKDLGLNPIFDPSAPAWASMAEFMGTARKRGARLYFAWPGIAENPVFASERYKKFFGMLQHHVEGMGIEVISSPSDFFLPIDEMYDTQYHPNGRGKLRRTERLLASLCDRIECQGSRNSE